MPGPRPSWCLRPNLRAPRRAASRSPSSRWCSCGSAGGTPSGTVTVSDGTEQCVGTVAAGSCTLTPTSAGAKTLTATYAGNANFTGSTSTGVSQAVNAASTTTTITAHTPNPSAVGQAVSFTFTRSEEHTSELQSRLHLVCR